MGWPYQFIDLSEAERHARRLSLDRYGLIAQLSSLLPVAVILLYRVSRWLIKKVAAQRVVYDVVPTSPAAKHQKQSSSATWAATVRRVAWWLGDDIQVAGQSWGQRDQMVVGFAWSAWLLFLCVVGTGNGKSLNTSSEHCSSPVDVCSCWWTTSSRYLTISCPCGLGISCCPIRQSYTQIATSPTDSVQTTSTSPRSLAPLQPLNFLYSIFSH